MVREKRKERESNIFYILRPSRFSRTNNWLVKTCVHEFAHALDWCDVEAFYGLAFLRHIGFGHDGVLEAVLGGFAQTLLAIGHRADFAGQADFTESNKIRR